MRAPQPLVSGAALVGAGVGMWPTPVPRTALVAGVVVACCVALATIAAKLMTRHARPTSPAAGWFCLASAGVLVAGGGVAALWWQRWIRSELGFPDIGTGWYATLLIPTVLIFCALMWLPRLTAMGAALVAALAAGYFPATAGVANAATVPDEVIYAPLTSAPAADRAEQLVAGWVDAGSASTVVIVVPTGSGWVDRSAVEGILARFDGDVDVLALQYSATTSWRAFLGDRGAAGESAVTMTVAVANAVAALPESTRPEVYLYGQSLGAIGADAARDWAAVVHPGLVRGTLLAGTPANTLTPNTFDGAPRLLIANPSDPVATWSPELLWRAPVDDGARSVGRDVPTVPWLPGISFLQNTIDLISALDGPAGTGHRYGTEQGTLLGD